MPATEADSRPTAFTSDLEAMAQALRLAHEAIGLSDPNPRVGCVITDAQGRVLGQGHTQAAGQAHAEVMALADAQARGHSTAGATAYVTLEPCAHHGRTPPCCDALIAARLKRVVVACEDPNPLVAGQGLARMRAAGITVDAGPFADEARELNIGFFSRMQRQRPWVRMKVAISLDGRTALTNGQSQWITGELARQDGHAWRKRAGAILTGWGTVRDDDPRLDVRHVPTTRQPLRVIIDSRLDTPLSARLLQAPGSALIYHAQQADHPISPQALALQSAGVSLQACPGQQGKVDLPAVLSDLAVRGINELHVEAGHKLNGSWVREGLVDEYLVYLAPLLMGQGRELAALGPFTQMDQTLRLRWHSITPLGEDLRLLARPLRVN